MRNRRVQGFFVFLSFLWCPAAVFSAEEGKSPAAKPGPKAEAFRRIQEEMNNLLAELAQLQIKYRTADEERRLEIQREWRERIAKGESLEPAYVEAALDAYGEAPNADKYLVDLLVKLLQQRVERDEFESANAIGKLLVANRCENIRVPNMAGIAAFAVNDFEAAEKDFQMAEESGYYKVAPEKDKMAQIGQFYQHSVPEYKKIWEKEKSLREREAEADTLPRVLLKTSKGDVELELFENQAPNTVANFISLVERGFYNGLTFHRVLGGFMAQGGDPRGNGTGGPGYSIACECYQPDFRRHFRGTISMAHAGRDTGGSQFFLTFVPTPHLDGRHTAFGRVVKGMDVLAKLQRRNPDDQEAPRADKIIEAKVLRKRDHAYEPKKMPE